GAAGPGEELDVAVDVRVELGLDLLDGGRVEHLLVGGASGTGGRMVELAAGGVADAAEFSTNLHQVAAGRGGQVRLQPVFHIEQGALSRLHGRGVIAGLPLGPRRLVRGTRRNENVGGHFHGGVRRRNHGRDGGRRGGNGGGPGLCRSRGGRHRDPGATQGSAGEGSNRHAVSCR